MTNLNLTYRNFPISMSNGGIKNASGFLLPGGNAVQIGYFMNNIYIPNSTDSYADLIANGFKVISSTMTIGIIVPGNYNGTFNGTISDNINNFSAYTVIGNNPNMNSATELGIYRHNNMYQDSQNTSPPQSFNIYNSIRGTIIRGSTSNNFDFLLASNQTTTTTFDPNQTTTTFDPNQTTTTFDPEQTTTTFDPEQTTTTFESDQTTTTFDPNQTTTTTTKAPTTELTTVPPTTEFVDNTVCETLRYWIIVCDGFCANTIVCKPH